MMRLLHRKPQNLIKKDGGKKGTVLSLCTSCTDDVELDTFLIKAVLSYRDQEGMTAITLLDPGARSDQI